MHSDAIKSIHVDVWYVWLIVLFYLLYDEQCSHLNTCKRNCLPYVCECCEGSSITYIGFFFVLICDCKPESFCRRTWLWEVEQNTPFLSIHSHNTIVPPLRDCQLNYSPLIDNKWRGNFFYLCHGFQLRATLTFDCSLYEFTAALHYSNADWIEWMILLILRHKCKCGKMNESTFSWDWPDVLMFFLLFAWLRII